MSKISFIIASLSSGGAEHQLCELLNNLAESHQFNEIELITFADMEDHYQISSKIKRIRIARGAGKITKYLVLFKTILLSNSTCIVGFGLRESRFTLLPILFRRLKFVVGDRNLSKDGWHGINRILYQILFKRANVIVPNSFSEGKQISKYFPEAANKINVITNYTDLHKYHPTGIPNNNPIRICIFARFNPQKNCERFIEAIKLLKSRTNTPFIFDWYGASTIKGVNTNPYYMQIQKQIVDAEVSANICLKEAVKNVEVKMAEYDAFCLPSLFEGFSNSISEAICCGKPCIVSDVSDNSVMVRDEENGFLFDPTNVDDMADKLLKFVNADEHTRCKMGERSREIAESLFSLEKFVNSYIQVLK